MYRYRFFHLENQVTLSLLNLSNEFGTELVGIIKHAWSH